MALAASMGHLLRRSGVASSLGAHALRVGAQQAAQLTSSAARQAALPAPAEDPALPQPSAAAQSIDWKQNLGAVRNNWT